MLTGITILSGIVYIEKKDESHDEDTLFNAMEVLKSAIEEGFSYNSYRQTQRFESDFCGDWEPVMNTGDLHTKELLKGETIRFYSHSDYLNMDRLIDSYKGFLNDIPYVNVYDKLSLTFEYMEISFSKSSPIIKEVSTNIRNIYVLANIGEPVEFIQKDRFEKNIEKLDILDIETNTNLLAFNNNTYLGVSNMYEQMAMLFEQSDKLDWFSGFDNKATENTAKMLSLELSKDKYGKKQDENTHKLIDILEGTMDERYLIGTPNLLGYMESVAPIILKQAMINGGL